MSHYTLEQALDSELDFKIMMGRVPGFRIVHKFGAMEDANTTLRDVWSFPFDKTYATTGVILYAWSTAADVTEMTITGLDENWAIVTKVVTLTGVTPVTLPGLWTRVFRVRNETPLAHVGTVYFSRGVTNAPGVPVVGEAEASSLPLTQGSQMCHFTVPAGHTSFVKNFHISTTKGKDVRAYGFHRDFGGIFNAEDILSTYQASDTKPLPYLPFSEKSDFVIRGLSDVTNTYIGATFDLILVQNDPHLTAV